MISRRIPETIAAVLCTFPVCGLFVLMKTAGKRPTREEVLQAMEYF